MSGASNITQRWSNFGSSTPTGPATSYRSVTASPSHFISMSHTKLHTLSLDLLYPTPSVPAAPKDSSELLRRSLLISNAMMVAKKQVKIERHSAYDEARYNKRNTSSRGHLRGTARSVSSSLHTLSSTTQQLDSVVEASVSTQGQIYAPSQAHSIEATEGEEWFEETWSETMHEGERDSAMFGSSGSTSISVRSEYQEFSSTHGSEVAYHTKTDDMKTQTDVHVLPVESDEDTSSAESSRSPSPVSGESEPDQHVEAELVAIHYTRPVVLPSQVLGVSSDVSADDSDVPDLWLDEVPEYEHVDVHDQSATLVRSEPSSSPLKPRLLPTIIRDKFYEPSRFETEVEEDAALVALSALPVTPSIDNAMSLDDITVDTLYSSSPTGSIVSIPDSDDEEDSDELRTPDETASDEFGYSGGNSSFDNVSPSSFDESVEEYFSSGYRSKTKDLFDTSDADWEHTGADIPLFP